MANQRKKGLKLLGAYIPGDQVDSLEWLAQQQGFADKSAYLRHLVEKEIEAKKAMLARKKPKQE